MNGEPVILDDSVTKWTELPEIIDELTVNLSGVTSEKLEFAKSLYETATERITQNEATLNKVSLCGPIPVEIRPSSQPLKCKVLRLAGFIYNFDATEYVSAVKHLQLTGFTGLEALQHLDKFDSVDELTIEMTSTPILFAALDGLLFSGKLKKIVFPSDFTDLQPSILKTMLSNSAKLQIYVGQKELFELDGEEFTVRFEKYSHIRVLVLTVLLVDKIKYIQLANETGCIDDDTWNDIVDDRMHGLIIEQGYTGKVIITRGHESFKKQHSSSHSYVSAAIVTDRATLDDLLAKC